MSDGYLNTSSVGALAVSDSDPNVVYAGMGESTIRNDVSHGDGVYRSRDGGQTWVHLGLADTRHISEIRVHPKDPDTVYVAAQGHAFGPNEHRGVFRSTDGGVNWEHVLYVNENAGAADLSLDPTNPDVLYASLWEARRSFWSMSSGGPDSGLWKSVDGGSSWTDITRNKGLPQEGLLGKIGVSASPAQAGRVWTLIEATIGAGLYRSDDFGETWQLTTDKQALRYRPWYYMHVFADPRDADTVYITNLDMWRSTDGGATFKSISTPHGDNHDLWIDPRDNRRMIEGNDGGANVSLNAGASWSSIYNQCTAQFYTVTTDNRTPYYRVYGTQQDNSSIGVPSSSNDGAIAMGDCFLAGTGESGYMAVHPEDPNIVYIGAVGSSPGGGGALQRYDYRTGQIRLVNVWPQAHGGIGAGELKYRFPWTFPILFSPHDPGVLYTAGNVVFRSEDEGHSWSVVSPDLTRGDADKLVASGGPITKDTSGAEHYCTVSTLRESPHEKGVLWAGTDDGLVHVSRDGGETWQDVTPPDLPAWTFVRTVEPSHHDPATLYVAATGYKQLDPKPYVYRTTDYGESWVLIVGNAEHTLPDDDPVRVVRVDPRAQGILYVGTETGLYVSLDDGTTWRRWRSNLPVAPVYDLAVKGSDLVVATHGRSFWIMDDLTPLHQVDQPDSSNGLVLFAPTRTWRVLPDLCEAWVGTEGKQYWVGLGKPATFVNRKDESGRVERDYLDAGKGAALGALIYYRLETAPAADAEAKLEFLDEQSNLIRAFRPKPAGYEQLSDEDKALDPGPWMPVSAGVNRFVWNLRYPGAKRLRGNKTGEEADRGPLLLPGTYQVQISVGGHSQIRSFEIVNDTRSDVTTDALQEQLSLLLEVRDKMSELYTGVERLRDVSMQLAHWRSRLGRQGDQPAIRTAAQTLEKKLAGIETVLIIPGEQTDLFGLNDRVRLNAALATVISVIESADARPTTQARELATVYTKQIDAELAKLQRALDEDLVAFNQMVAEANLPAVLTT